MRLKNIVIAVTDIDRSIKFYKELFGLQVILHQEGNVMLTEGLVLQDAKLWSECLGKELLPKSNMTELYFEEADMDGLVKKLEGSEFEIEYVTEVTTFSWGQQVVRLYDPDGHLIEVRTPAN